MNKFLLKLRNKVVLDKSNNLEIGEGVKIRGCIIKVRGSNNVVKLKKNSNLSGVNIEIRGNDCLVEIGQNSIIGHNTYLSVKGEKKSIIIGKDCMFSRNNRLLTFDGHDIFKDGIKVNEPKSIEIGDEVWLADGATILKGVKITKGSVVGIASLVTKEYLEENVILGGNPAKIIKRGITWKK
ncbi:MAG: acyltransferase [Cetobacterium sp.]|uniref:acyltransferase n=1 Tax=Cetobacterium sp. TaxID=2071632 RepID=UPI003F40C390